jgi:tight adherence protein C
VGAKILSASALLVVTAAASMPLVGALFAFLAWRVPEIALARRARRRLAAASSEMPLFLDLLSVSCSAGVAPQLAVRMSAAPLRGPLAAELDRALEWASLGRRWRDELDAAADRLGLAELRRVVAILGGSETLGYSLADEMSRLAVDARESRRARATERARTAPVKMLFPLVFLILPAFLLLTVVPVLLSTVRSIG